MPDIKIFYTSDIHGSQICFRKFVSAGKFYGVHAIIMGGDITGKMVIPIIEQPDGSYTCELYGQKHRIRRSNELDAIKTKIRDVGYYYHQTTLGEFVELQTAPEKVDELFANLMVESVEQWVKIVEENLKGTDIKCLVMPGNDDRLEIDHVLEKSSTIVNPEGRVIELDRNHEMISTGYSNITPWKCPRDIPEEELSRKIDSMAQNVRSMKSCLFNFHCPPFGTDIDSAPHLDSEMRPIIKGGRIEMVPVGSVAVRASIEKYQPVLGLHGHIHESKGFSRIGRSLCINPGSEYGEGYLRGVIVVLNEDGVKKHQFTTG